MLVNTSNFTVNSNLIVRNVNYNHGREVYFSIDSNSIGTTSTTYLNKSSLNVVVEGGNYLFIPYYGMRTANTNRIGMGRVQLSNANGATQFIHTASNSLSTNGETWNCDPVFLNLPAGSNKFTFQYCVNSVNGGTTVTVPLVKLNLIRTNVYSQITPV